MDLSDALLTASLALLIVATLLTMYVHREGPPRWLRRLAGRRVARPRGLRRWPSPPQFFLGWVGLYLISLARGVALHEWRVSARLGAILVGAHIAIIVLLVFSLFDELWLERRGMLYTEEPPPLPSPRRPEPPRNSSISPSPRTHQ